MVNDWNVDMANLLPCKRALTQHIRRVNHQVRNWKTAHIPQPQIPKASQGNGWEEKDGNLDPLWNEGDVLPRQLADIAEVTPDDTDSDEDSDMDAFDDIEQALESDDDSDNEYYA